MLYELLKCTAWHVFILGRLIILTSVIDMNFVFPDVSKSASICDVYEDGPSSVLDHPVVLSTYIIIGPYVTYVSLQTYVTCTVR